MQRLRRGRWRRSKPSRMLSASPTVEPPEDGGRHAVDVEPAVVDVGRLAERRRVGGEVAPASSCRGAPGSRAVGVGAQRRMLDGLRTMSRADRARGRSAPGPCGRSARRCAARSGLRWTSPTAGGLAAGVRYSVPAGGEVVEVAALSLTCWLKVLSTTKPSRAICVAGPQQRLQRAGAVALERGLPRADGPGDADAEPADARLGEVEGRLGGSGRRTRPAVMPAGAVSRESIVSTRWCAGVVDDHEAAAADAARERLDHAEHAGRRDRGVDGVAAGAEGVDRRLGGERVDRRGGAAAADRGRGRRRGWNLRPRGERGDQHHQDCQDYETSDTRHSDDSLP